MTYTPLGKVWSSSAIRRFAVQVGVLLVLFSTAVVVGIYFRTEQMVMSGVRQQAGTYLDLIVATRAWNAAYGGVWISEGPGARTNEYLRELGVEADTSTVAGTELTLRNPAAMTRELSELVSRSGVASFRLTSLDPVNPSSAPDAWERPQLLAFERGLTRAQGITRQGERRAYRMMKPLFTDRECLGCHGVQGYQAGEVRGALSVTLDLAQTDAELRRNAWGLLALWMAIVIALGFIMYGLVFRMAARLERGESRLKVLATTDELTHLPNRRTSLERLALELERSRRDSSTVGVIAVDIDHFKAVNDTYGHPAGDAVLEDVARTMHESLRVYDMVGRVGGEEFLVVAPGVDEAELIALGERIRWHVEQAESIVAAGARVRVTLSAGCTLSAGEDETTETVLGRADAALYGAKSNGRNRVEML